MNKLPSVTNTGVSMPAKSRLLALTDKLTFDKIVKGDTWVESKKQRELDLKAFKKDCQNKIKRYDQELAEIEFDLKNFVVQNIGDDAGSVMEVGKLIFECSRQFNVNNNLDEKQIDYLAADIVSEYKAFKIEEVAFVLRKGIMGNFGKVDFKLDANSIHIWFKKYKEQKDEYYHNQRIAKEDREVRNSYI